MLRRPFLPGFGRRATAIAVALAIEVLLLLALLSLGLSGEPPPKPLVTDVRLSSEDVAEPEPEEPTPEKAEPSPAQQSQPQPVETSTPVLAPAPVPVPVITLPQAPPAPAPPPPAERPRPPAAVIGPVYGPPDTGGPKSDDSERVGTAPNGEPLYAAKWYTEPGADFRGYLSSASPGWGLMACRTIPDFYVTDCVPLGETQGSMLTRSMLAGSGTLRVRPPRLGGRSLVGAWVRIRIDYTVQRK